MLRLARDVLINATEEKGPWLAGGWLYCLTHGYHPNDLDIFFSSEEQFLEYNEWFKQNAYAVKITYPRSGNKYYCANTYTYYGIKFQLIYMHYFDDYDSLMLDWIDFGVCQAVYNPNMGIVMSTNYTEHTKNRIIEVESWYNIDNKQIKRIEKYKQRGLTVGPILQRKIDDYLCIISY